MMSLDFGKFHKETNYAFLGKIIHYNTEELLAARVSVRYVDAS